MPKPRLATPDDLKALHQLERICFQSDRLSNRSFRHFMEDDRSVLWVIGAPTIAYGVVLFHSGTSLARIYSLAVHPEEQGKGLAKRLLHKMELSAIEHDCLFVRLEVSDKNVNALGLYQAMGYKIIERVEDYYDNGDDALRLEKPLKRHTRRPTSLPFYAQTTDFTCGPAALMMGMRAQDQKFKLNQINELNIWREATTIFMTSGHGGCSPHGLAVAAASRNHDVELWVTSTEIPFLDSVRNEDKKKIIQIIHKEFLKNIKKLAVDYHQAMLSLPLLRKKIASGYSVIVLISTYRLNRNKAPHWVWVVNIDDHYVYINDPDIDTETLQISDDSIYVPVPHASFIKMMGYGTKRYGAALLIKRKE